MGTGTNAVEIDLMMPIDPNKAPKVHIPTLNHIGLWVDNLEGAVEDLSSKVGRLPFREEIKFDTTIHIYIRLIIS